ncbi:CHAT domain-containing protein [Tolypothrix sp. NIES-4075]|uniref:CHAT domain-containing protein n=1 Tax=Tolypothrix sp. NIES-4075 TaxID=2005459 RepID=UPI00135BD57A|nr:tetratricopeptide repeat protein [Tolypothrix sp. NIES-4075]
MTVLIALLSGMGSGYFEFPNPIHILTDKTLAQTPKPFQSEAEGLVNQGIQQAEKSQFDAAINSWQSALTIYKELDDRFSQGALLNYIGLAYRNSGQYQKALVYLQQALDVLTAVQDRAGIGTTWNNIGLVYSNLNRHKDALKAYQQALVIKKEFDDRRGQATLLNNIGTAYRNLSEYNEALKVYQQARTLFKSVLDKSGEGTTLNNIGGVYNNLGQYSQALSVYQQALDLLKSVNDKAGEGTTLNNIGVLYRNLGQYDEALKYYQQALDIINKLGKRTLIATTLNNIGEVYDSQGKYEEALNKYQQALDVRKQLQDKAGEGTTLNSIGAAYRNLRQYQEALKVYQQALAIREEVRDEGGKATTLNNMGNVYLDLLQHNEALKLYQQALTIYEKVGDKPDIGTTLNNIGSAYLQARNLEQAIATLYKAINVLDSLRSSELSDANKVALFETQDHTYRLLQKALIAQNKIEEALEVAERGRARAFVELLSKRISSNTNAQPTISPPTIKQIQQIAQAQKATLVEYSIISDQELLIWVIKPTGEIDVRQVDLKSLNTSLQDFVVTSRTFIGARGRGGIGVVAPLDDSPTQRLQKLHQILIEPIADLLPTNPEARVIFLPHKSLFLIPFVALQDIKGKYLIEKHTILTAPAIQVLDLTRKQRQQVSGKGALVVGNPKIEPQVRREYKLDQLGGAEREAIKIAQILKTKALIGNQPTKAAILQQIPSARIIHLATHGLLDDVKKLGIPGAIVLAPDGKDNGLLTSGEILDLKLNAELVVLSACDSGQGKLTGDGVIGLSRSLITSGASSVIVTLWKIPDYPSALLMTEFYQNLKRDYDKATALRSAMLTTMKKYPNPIDWAAFTLIGEAE